MNGGGSQSPSFSTGNSGGSSSWGQSGMGANSGWQQPFSTSNPQQSPFFNMSQQAPQQMNWSSQQTPWAAMSPSYNAFSQAAASPLSAQSDIQSALQQQAAITAAQPSSAPVQNFTLADANITAGLPATGMPQPVTQTPVAPTAPALATPNYNSIMQNWLTTGRGSQPQTQEEWGNVNTASLNAAGKAEHGNTYDDYLRAHQSFV